MRRNRKSYRYFYYAYCVSMMVIVIMVLEGCANNPITNPKPALLETEIDYGPPEYRKGYHDGCASALSAYGNTYMRTMQGGIHKDARYTALPIYNQAWKDSWNYCYMWIFVYRREGGLL